MAEKKTYTGGCHCGEVRFEVTARSQQRGFCSICQKRGALWVFATPESFALRAGLEDLKDYQFGKKAFIPCSARNAAWAHSLAALHRAAARWSPLMCAAWMTVDVTGLKFAPFDGHSL
jgi:hypothetical protein